MEMTRAEMEEIVRRGQKIYEETLRDLLEPENRGKFLVINVDTGEYEMGDDDVAAGRRASARFAEGPRFMMRIGYPPAYRFGARAPRVSPQSAAAAHSGKPNTPLV